MEVFGPRSLRGDILIVTFQGVQEGIFPLQLPRQFKRYMFVVSACCM
jgi:hypothetical protein